MADRGAAAGELVEALTAAPAKLGLYGLVGLARNPADVAEEVLADLARPEPDIRRRAERAVFACCWPGMSPPAEWWRGALGMFVGDCQAAFVESDLTESCRWSPSAGEFEVTVTRQTAPAEPATGWVGTFLLEEVFTSMPAGIAGPDGLLFTSPGWRTLGLERMWIGPTPTGTAVLVWVVDAAEGEPGRAVELAGEGVWTLFDDGVFYQDPPASRPAEALRWRQPPMIPPLRDRPQPADATAKYWRSA